MYYLFVNYDYGCSDIFKLQKYNEKIHKLIEVIFEMFYDKFIILHVLQGELVYAFYSSDGDDNIIQLIEEEKYGMNDKDKLEKINKMTEELKILIEYEK